MQIPQLLWLLIILTIQTACSQPEPPTINLYRAVHIGDLDQVERNLYWNSDIDQTGPDGQTALHIATRKGSLVMVKMLVEQGANLEAENSQGRTPLATALLARNTLVANYLAKQHARLDPDKLLHLTVRQGEADRDVIEFLLNQGADLDKPDDEGNTALHLAINQGNRVIAKYLVQRGADIDKTDSAGRTPLQLAIELKQTDIEKMLQRFGATGG